MIILSADDLTALADGKGGALRFRQVGDGNTFTTLGVEEGDDAAAGHLCLSAEPAAVRAADVGQAADRIRVVAWCNTDAADADAGKTASNGLDLRGYVRCGGEWREDLVRIIPSRRDLFSRTAGLFETDVLAGRKVFISGLGSMGSLVVIELAKSGVTNFILMDHDRIEVANVNRHLAGLRDVGRLKTEYMAEAIWEKNPYANVKTYPIRITGDVEDLIRETIDRSDLSVCLADDHEARQPINRFSVELGKPALFAGAFRRAYGGQILFYRPGGPCYQCFLHALGEAAHDQKIASAARAQAVAYSDQPVPIEPGLSTDIAPISLMVTKLAVQYLLKGKETTLRSLDEDLVAPWFIWLNRREKGTPYEKLGPLEYNVNGLRVLQWHGVDFRADPACPCCGDFVAAMTSDHGQAAIQTDVDLLNRLGAGEP